MSIPSAQVLVLKNIFYKRNKEGLLREMDESEAEAERVLEDAGTFCLYQRIRACFF